jgi:hypothetical protein
MKMEMVTQQYRGFVITYPQVPVDASRWIVNLSSNEPLLNVQLRGGNEVYTDHRTLEGAIKKAKNRVDGILGPP